MVGYLGNEGRGTGSQVRRKKTKLDKEDECEDLRI
jgi:hypothetical protein